MAQQNCANAAQRSDFRSFNITTLNAHYIASLCLGNPAHQLAQITHRVNLVSKWDIKAGDHVLELGCGPGLCTAVLASAVGASGSVTALDPAPLDYGAPITLGQGQAHLKASPIGTPITFLRADTFTHLASTKVTYDVAVLFRLLPTYDPSCSLSPHGLLGFALPTTLCGPLGPLEAHKVESISNVRSVFSPVRVKQLAADVGLILDADSECVVQAPEELRDGNWEVVCVVRDSFAREIEEAVADERQREVVYALREAVSTSKDGLGAGVDVSTMDVWSAVFIKE